MLRIGDANAMLYSGQVGALQATIVVRLARVPARGGAMSRQLSDRTTHQAEHDFKPDFAWAAVGGLAAVVICVSAFLLVGALGWDASGAPASTYYREFSGAFLAGLLAVLVMRNLGTRTA